MFRQKICIGCNTNAAVYYYNLCAQCITEKAKRRRADIPVEVTKSKNRKLYVALKETWEKASESERLCRRCGQKPSTHPLPWWCMDCRRNHRVARWNADLGQNRAKARETQRAFRKRSLFKRFALRLVHREGATIRPIELWGLWRRQRGRCALTGRLLNGRNPNSVSLDHIFPKHLGGQTSIGELRWVTLEANQAKWKLTDNNFKALCVDVVAHARLVPLPCSVQVASPC